MFKIFILLLLFNTSAIAITKNELRFSFEYKKKQSDLIYLYNFETLNEYEKEFKYCNIKTKIQSKILKSQEKYDKELRLFVDLFKSFYYSSVQQRFQFVPYQSTLLINIGYFKTFAYWIFTINNFSTIFYQCKNQQNEWGFLRKIEIKTQKKIDFNFTGNLFFYLKEPTVTYEYFTDLQFFITKYLNFFFKLNSSPEYLLISNGILIKF